MAVPTSGYDHKWVQGDALVKAINKSGFEVNLEKTRVQYRGSRQVVTGLPVNDKVNVRPEYYKTMRSMCHSLFKSDNYYRMLPSSLIGAISIPFNTKEDLESLAPLQGMLSQIHYVRNGFDKRKLQEKQDNPTATWTLYYRFLFYSNFVALRKPLIITEGETDPTYLRSAIEKLTVCHPRLS